VEKTVWSRSLSMSIYLVARLGTVCVSLTRAVPLFFDGLPDSLFRYCLSTARGPPCFRLWNFAVFFDLIFFCARPAIDYRLALYPHIRDLRRCCREAFPSSDARTNRSHKPCSGSFTIGYYLVTTRYWNIRTLPFFSTMCQDDVCISLPYR